jgi:EmrB/QacA subfamily drug resistance transporter
MSLVARLLSVVTRAPRTSRTCSVDPDGRVSIDHVADDEVPDAAPPATNYRLCASIIACALFMENLDATVLTTALPTMARDFGVRAPEMSVTVTAYLLAIAVFIPVSGFAADRFGTRRIFSAAILVFVAGSVGCALSPGLPLIALARFFQGIGGAMMVPVGRLILLRSVARKDLVAAQSWLLMPGLMGTILGPPVGGLIVTYADWHWIFWMNVPIGAAGAMLVRRFIGNFRESRRAAFDATGFTLSGLALGGLMVGFELAGPAGDSRAGWLVIAVAALLGAAYLLHARKARDPILDLSLVRIPTFRLALIGGSLTRIIQGAQPFLLSLMMQLGFGFTAARSGSITFATALGTFLMKGIVSPLLRRLGFRRGLSLMGVLGGSAYALCGFFRPDWPLPLIYAVLILAGFFLSFQFTAYNTVAYSDVPTARMSKATSFYSTFQQLSLSLGVCTAATTLHVSAEAGGRHAPALLDFSLAFWIAAAIGLGSFFFNIRFARNAGSELSGHQA